MFISVSDSIIFAASCTINFDSTQHGDGSCKTRKDIDFVSRFLDSTRCGARDLQDEWSAQLRAIGHHKKISTVRKGCTTSFEKRGEFISRLGGEESLHKEVAFEQTVREGEVVNTLGIRRAFQTTGAKVCDVKKAQNFVKIADLITHLWNSIRYPVTCIYIGNRVSSSSLYSDEENTLNAVNNCLYSVNGEEISIGLA